MRMKNQIWILLICVLISTACKKEAKSESLQQQDSSQDASCHNSPQLVDLVLIGSPKAFFKIPKAYLYEETNLKGGEQAAIKLKMGNISCAKYDDLIIEEISEIKIISSSSDDFENFKRNAQLTYTHLLDEDNIFNVYCAPQEGDQSCKGQKTFLSPKKENSSKPIFVICENASFETQAMPSNLCVVEEAFQSNIRTEYVLKRENLSSIHQISEKINNFLLKLINAEAKWP